MSKNNENNNPLPLPNDNDPPLDDYGIGHDRILEICEKIIEKIHTKYVIDDADVSSVSEYKDIIQSVQSCWELTKGILDLDDIVYSAMQALENGEKLPGEEDGQDDIIDGDDFEDLDDGDI